MAAKDKEIRANLCFARVEPQPAKLDTHLTMGSLHKLVSNCWQSFDNVIPGSEGSLFQKLVVVVQPEVMSPHLKLPGEKEWLRKYPPFSSLGFFTRDYVKEKILVREKIALRTSQDIRNLITLKDFHDRMSDRKPGYESKPLGDAFVDEKTVTIVIGQVSFLMLCAVLFLERTGRLREAFMTLAVKLAELGEADLEAFREQSKVSKKPKINRDDVVYVREEGVYSDLLDSVLARADDVKKSIRKINLADLEHEIERNSSFQGSQKFEKTES